MLHGTRGSDRPDSARNWRDSCNDRLDRLEIDIAAHVAFGIEVDADVEHDLAFREIFRTERTSAPRCADDDIRLTRDFG